MKKFLLVVAVVALCGVFQNAKAQFSAGVGLNYATEINNLGISAQVAYDFTEDWAATGAFTYYLKKENTTYTSVDVNANYSFTTIENMGKLYGIAGLNYLSWSFDTPDHGGNIPGLGHLLDDLASDSEFGVNLGIGLKMDLSEKMLLCPEFMYSSAGSGYIRLGARLMFKF